MTLKTNIEIAQAVDCLPIEEVAAKIGLSKDDLQLYGKYTAKVPLEILKRFDEKPNGKLIVMTAITPTPAGEGKTVTTIGLVQGLGKLDKKKTYLIYTDCSCGGVGFNTLYLMKDMGFRRVYNMWEGFQKWKEEGLPVAV